MSASIKKDYAAIANAIQLVQAGDREAIDRLVQLAYKRLYRIANQKLGRQLGRTPTLHATALLNESILRMYRNDSFSDITSPEHFLARFATITRHALIDYRRHRQAKKRSHGLCRTHVDTVTDHLLSVIDNPIEVQEELELLRAKNARWATIFEMGCFGCYTQPEIAEALSISVSTVQSDLRFARAFLRSLQYEECLV